MQPEDFADVARWYAFASVAVSFLLFTVLTKWYRNASLIATWILFTGLLAVLLLSVTSRYQWYPIEWRLWVTGGTWIFIGGLFTLWAFAFVREQTRPRPGGGHRVALEHLSGVHSSAGEWEQPQGAGQPDGDDSRQPDRS